MWLIGYFISGSCWGGSPLVGENANWLSFRFCRGKFEIGVAFAFWMNFKALQLSKASSERNVARQTDRHPWMNTSLVLISFGTGHKFVKFLHGAHLWKTQTDKIKYLYLFIAVVKSHFNKNWAHRLTMKISNFSWCL